jgi:hypothetical protein
MPQKPTTQFGKREAAIAAQQVKTTKRSGHVALLLAGTVAVGGGAYALMPGENCAPNQPGMAAPANAGCSPRSSSSGGGSSRYGFYSGDSSANKSAPGTSPSDSGSGNVTRGGFGSFAHAFTSHFSGGG